ncbi:MAG: protein kinase [Calothrix sp. MO_167.B12]|nr:protein kinase [Calothrix sp. MO_167.B12]
MKTIKLLNNRYQVIQVLGSGGFGETFLAEDTHMPSRRRCVIKQLKPVSNDPQTYKMIQQRFEREAATLEYLGEGSDRIPKLYAYFSENGQFYLVQEWIQGQTLADVVESQGTLNESIVRGIVSDLLPVLHYVHSKGIIHRDIKPDNIMLEPSSKPWGKPMLIDFGAVKETIRFVGNSSGSPTRSLVIGTPGYMPNEQATGHPVYGTDLYSLGLTAVYLLTGKHPQELEANLQTGEIIWREHLPGISPDFAMVIDRAIKPNVSDRYGTAMQMLSDLHSSPSVMPPAATQATIALAPRAAANNQETQPLSPSQKIATIPPQQDRQGWQKPGLIIGSLLVGGLIGAVAIATMNRQPQLSNNVTKSTTNIQEKTDINPVTESPIPTLSPDNTPNSSDRASTPAIPNTPNPEVTPTPAVTSEASTPQPVATPENTETSPPVVISPTTPENTQTSPTVDSPPPKKTASIGKEPPAFPAGTARSDVEAVLGSKRDLRGLWGDTRAVTYKFVPNQIDLGYLFDRKTGVLRQTEASFAQSVDPQLMQDTLNGMLAGKATPKIQQGLQKVQQRQSKDFNFSLGDWKGQIIRQNCGFIYISVWDADLHDFVNPATARKC